MEVNINKEIVSRSLDAYGNGLQLVVCMEELSELTRAISKEIRGKGDRDNTIEEMADVLICIEIIKQVFGITDEDIDSWIKYKQERNLFRMNCPQAD
jgi:NTP pyrophosphatase (non-canonical NTP hydrolase)